MPDELQTRTPSSQQLVRESRQGAYLTQSKRPTPWLLRNEKFVRAMCMVGLYVFGAIFLVSMLAVGVFTLVSLVLAILFLASLAMVLALWARSRLRR
jgi:hypothetical protein